MVETQRLAIWIRRNRLALIVSGILLIIGLSWIIPPQENIFVLQRRLQEIWIIILGIVSVPFWLLILDMPILALLMLAPIALIFGGIIQAVWSGNILSKSLLIICFLLNGFVGFSVLSIGLGDGWLAQTEPQLLCESVTPAGEGIRIQSYVLTYADGGLGQYFFSSTKDGGKTWDQIGSISYNFGISSCGESQRFGNTDFSIWTCKPEKDEHPRPSVCPVG